MKAIITLHRNCLVLVGKHVDPHIQNVPLLFVCSLVKDGTNVYGERIRRQTERSESGFLIAKLSSAGPRPRPGRLVGAAPLSNSRSQSAGADYRPRHVAAVFTRSSTQRHPIHCRHSDTSCDVVMTFRHAPSRQRSVRCHHHNGGCDQDNGALSP